MTARAPTRRLAPSAPACRVVSAPGPSAVPQLVFAYGSNLRAAQMLSRCPSAQPAGVGRLRQHRLVFVGYSSSWRGAVATVEPCELDAVDGALWDVSAADLLELDQHEGVPWAYSRQRLRVSTGPGLAVLAWVYRREGPQRPGGPSYRYLAAILEGALAWGLDPEAIVAAAERSGLPPF